MIKTQLLKTIREQQPIVYSLTNSVTIETVANTINTVGASPIMSEALEESQDLPGLAKAILINTGTVNPQQFELMKAVMHNTVEQPLVLDPVAVGASSYRSATVKELLAIRVPTVIRGNAGEIAHLAEIDWQSHGIDAGEGNGDLVAIAQACAKKYDTTVVLTGVTDVITDGTRTTLIHNGTPLFAQFVGAGDMVTGTIAAFLAVEADAYVAASTALAVFGTAGEELAEPVTRPLAFRDQLQDELLTWDPAQSTVPFKVEEL